MFLLLDTPLFLFTGQLFLLLRPFPVRHGQAGMSTLIYVALFMFACRLLLLRRTWSQPMRHGQDYFLGQRVGADFHRQAGKELLRRYRISLLVFLFLDAPLALWLAFTGREITLSLEQVLAIITTVVLYNLVAYHFSFRTAAIAGPQEPRPSTVQLSMAPRRLRDHINRAVEAVVVIATLASLALLARSYALSVGPHASHDAIGVFRGGLVATTWVLYWQIGLLLIKGVFVR